MALPAPQVGPEPAVSRQQERPQRPAEGCGSGLQGQRQTAITGHLPLHRGHP